MGYLFTFDAIGAVGLAVDHDLVLRVPSVDRFHVLWFVCR